MKRDKARQYRCMKGHPSATETSQVKGKEAPTDHGEMRVWISALEGPQLETCRCSNAQTIGEERVAALLTMQSILEAIVMKHKNRG
jgi:hypothetical protein